MQLCHLFLADERRICMKINELLQKVRMSMGWTQNYIASEIGVDVSTYSRYEAGTTEIKLSHFLKIVKVCNIKPFKMIENYILNDDLELVEEPNINYGRQLAEAEAKIKDLNDEKSRLKKDIDLLEKLIRAKDESIELMRAMIEKEGGKKAEK